VLRSPVPSIQIFNHSRLQVALLSMNATAVGLDFSCATAVVFAEVPDTADVLLQAEGRAHRMTSKSAVNVYVLLCKQSKDVRTWCRLAESLERQAPLMDTRRRSHGAAPADVAHSEAEGQAQHAEHAREGAEHDHSAAPGAVQGSHTRYVYEDVGAGVRAARAVAIADASGHIRRPRGNAGGGSKKALHVDDVIDLSVALKKRRAADGDPVCNVTASHACDLESESAHCRPAECLEVQEGDEGGDAVDNAVSASSGHTKSDAQRSGEAADVSGAVNVSSGEGEDAIACAKSNEYAAPHTVHVASWLSAQEEPARVCKDDTNVQPAATMHLPPCSTSQAAARLKQDLSSQQGSIFAADAELGETGLKQSRLDAPAGGNTDASGKHPRAVDIDGVSLANATEDPVSGVVSSAGVTAQESQHIVASGDELPVAECAADAAGTATEPDVLMCDEHMSSEQKAGDGSKAQVEPCPNEARVDEGGVDELNEGDKEDENDDRDMHADLPEWLALPASDQSDSKHHDDMKDSEKEKSCKQSITEVRSQCGPHEELHDMTAGSQEVTGLASQSSFDTSRVFFMVNHHTENVTLLLGEEGGEPLGLRLPLSALQPAAAGAVEEHVEHLKSLLKV
jgi:hypothetical protein